MQKGNRAKVRKVLQGNSANSAKGKRATVRQGNRAKVYKGKNAKVQKCKRVIVQKGQGRTGKSAKLQKCNSVLYSTLPLLHFCRSARLPLIPYIGKKRRLGNSKGAVFFIRRLSFPASFSGVFLFRRLFLASLFFGVFYDRCAKVQTGIRVELQNG